MNACRHGVHRSGERLVGPRRETRNRRIEKGYHMKEMLCEEDHHGYRDPGPPHPRESGVGDHLETMNSQPGGDRLTAEERLVERCLRGEATAWDAVFQVCHPRLVSYITMVARERSREQAEEVAAAVWCSLCCGGATHLRRYDPQSGGLLRCLKRLARGEIWRRRRSERSRRVRECIAARQESTRDEVGRGLVLQEFLATLTRREREFCLTILLGVPELGGRPPVSVANEWKIRSRVLKKFRTNVLGEQK
jgi:hypothetical protein